VLVNSLPLPPSLLALIEAGRWRCPADQSGLDRLFPERGEFCCYSFGGMEGETQVIYRNPTPMWRGIPDPANPPGDIDPKLAVLIADLGIGYDQPIALDYRLSREHPRVLTLRWDKPDPPIPWEEIEPWQSGKRHYDKATTARLRSWYDTTRQGGWNRWVEIAPDFEMFAELIGL
jgi:hypothetical protein